VDCILTWCAKTAQHARAAKRPEPDAAPCPQCREPFAALRTYRQLDGTFSDFLVEEGVGLLQRAGWFQCRLADEGKGKTAVDFDAVPQLEDYGLADDEDDYDEDDYYDEMDDYYVSSGSGRPRVMIGNRRWGRNGYVASGRMVARPRANPQPPRGGSSSRAVRNKGRMKQAPKGDLMVDGSLSVSPSPPSAGAPYLAGQSPPLKGKGPAAAPAAPAPGTPQKKGRRAKRREEAERRRAAAGLGGGEPR